jgi:two-component system, cell cycle sensor histidine kinase DivJ
MCCVNLVVPVREYIDSLVHSSARHDPLLAARHRAFLAPRILGGLAGLAIFPIYLAVRRAPNILEVIAFAWLVLPVAIAYTLSRSGEYERAHIHSAFALAALVTLISAMSGGLPSPAAVWLVLIPLEAALCASRRVVAWTAGCAIAGLLVLVAADFLALTIHASPSAGTAYLFEAISTAAALIYAVLLAFGSEAMAHVGSSLLRREERRYRLLTANMTDVITRHGRNGTVLFVSPAAERVFGVDGHELIGHGLFDRVHVADRPAYLTVLTDTALQGGERSVEFRVRRDLREVNPKQSQHFVWVEMRCRALDPPSPGASAAADREVVAVMRNITGRKAQDQAIEEARSEAEQANAAKSRFLATMSHELRTPLNAVIGFSEMLMSESSISLDADRRSDYARLINDSGHHLLSVVNLVLDMSKIESGNFVITPEPFAPAAVIRNCCELLALKACEVGLDIVIDVPDDLPEIVADKRALKQMLLNLLSNAIKFTDRGGRVTVTALIRETQIVIAVVDTGVGIGQDDLLRVGDPFFQARGSYNRPYDGTGLGLSIVKGLAGLHGGRMEIESHLGEGTQVTLRLPIDCEKPGEGGKQGSLGKEMSDNVATLPVVSNWQDLQVKKRA